MASYGGFNSEEDFGMPGYQNGIDGAPNADAGGQSSREHQGNQQGAEQSGGGGADTADEGRGGGEGHDTAVFIGNLQWWTTDVELETLCSEYGNVASMRFIEDKACGKSRGMAVVDFGDTEAAARCVNGLSGKEINGRPCRVTYQSQRGHFGGSSNREGGRSMGPPAGGRGMPAPPSRGGGRGMPGPPARGGPGRGTGMVPYDDFPGPMMGDMMGMGMMGMPGMMGMGPMGMDMMGMGMMGGPMGMGMPPFGMPGPGMGSGMGFKPPPPPGPPPKKEEN